MPASWFSSIGTGRRKTAVARVFLRPGKGQITVNGRPFDNYFVNESARATVRQPLLATETADKFDVMILARRRRHYGQAGAARLGIARALIEFNPELRGKLKELGFLTRDARAARAEEVRPEGRPQPLPVLQALVLLVFGGPRRFSLSRSA